MVYSKQQIIQKFHHAFIVSCQALKTEPLHGASHMQKMVLAAIEGGANALRMNSAIDIIAAKKVTDLPIIGIVKQNYEHSEIFITPTKKEIDQIAHSGAEIVAIDMTNRQRPTDDSLADLTRYAHQKGLFVMADLAELGDAKQAANAGVDFLGTTLSGYTENTKYRNNLPDFDFMENLVKSYNIPVIAEGRINTKDQAIKALDIGCHSVVVGSAISRPQLIAKTFGDAISLWRKKMNDTIIAIDLGATNIRFAILTYDGNIQKIETLKTQGYKTSSDIISAIIKHINQMITSLKLDISAVSIASAGQIDIYTGAVVQATQSIMGWENKNLKTKIEKELKIPCYIDNDANLALLGEYHFGAAKGKKTTAMLTLGTGLGGGIMINGNLHHGSEFLSANWGQSLIYHSIKKKYVFSEEIISGTGLTKLAKLLNCPFLEGEKIIEAAKQGDIGAVQVVSIFCEYLARLIHQIQYSLNPQTIIIGGGMSDSFADWSPFLFNAMKDYHMKNNISVAELKNNAGLLGAGALYFKS